MLAVVDVFGHGLGFGLMPQLPLDSIELLALVEERFRPPNELTRLEGSSSVKLTGDTAAVKTNINT